MTRNVNEPGSKPPRMVGVSMTSLKLWANVWEMPLRKLSSHQSNTSCVCSYGAHCEHVLSLAGPWRCGILPQHQIESYTTFEPLLQHHSKHKKVYSFCSLSMGKVETVVHAEADEDCSADGLHDPEVIVQNVPQQP